MVTSFLGIQTDGQIERHGFGILIWKHVGTHKNINSKLKISGYPSIPICLPGGRGCIINATQKGVRLSEKLQLTAALRDEI